MPDDLAARARKRAEESRQRGLQYPQRQAIEDPLLCVWCKQPEDTHHPPSPQPSYYLPAPLGRLCNIPGVTSQFYASRESMLNPPCKERDELLEAAEDIVALADRVDEQERRIRELKSRIEELDNLERQNRQKFGRQLRRLDAIGAKLSLANWHLYKTWEQTGTCLCGARKESPDTHPHTSACPTADAIREWHETEALSQKGGE